MFVMFQIESEGYAMDLKNYISWVSRTPPRRHILAPVFKRRPSVKMRNSKLYILILWQMLNSTTMTKKNLILLLFLMFLLFGPHHHQNDQTANNGKRNKQWEYSMKLHATIGSFQTMYSKQDDEMR
jgi:hypothetical protein